MYETILIIALTPFIVITIGSFGLVAILGIMWGKEK
jgi:hypothetical protein